MTGHDICCNVTKWLFSHIIGELQWKSLENWKRSKELHNSNSKTRLLIFFLIKHWSKWFQGRACYLVQHSTSAATNGTISPHKLQLELLVHSKTNQKTPVATQRHLCSTKGGKLWETIQKTALRMTRGSIFAHIDFKVCLWGITLYSTMKSNLFPLVLAFSMMWPTPCLSQANASVVVQRLLSSRC